MRLKSFFRPPDFEDERKSQQAYMLHVILWALIPVPIIYFVYILVATPEDLIRAAIQASFGETVNIILLLMLHRGFVRPASIIQVAAFWLFFTGTAITGDGVQGEAYLLGYAVVITIAGILLGGRGALVFTLLSLVTGAYMAIIPFGETSQASILDNFTTWVLSLLLFSLMAILQSLAANRVRKSLDGARVSEEKYRLISTVSSDYTFSTKVDEKGNMFLNWVAGAFEEITGYSYDEYVATGGWVAHLHPNDIEQDNRDMDQIRANKKVITELRTITKNKEIRWVRVFGHPVWDEKTNQLAGIVGAVEDITERKQVEKERERLIMALELKNTELEAKNAELERFTYTVSHDLKSPLVTITGFLGYLKDDALQGRIESIQVNIERISAAAKKMQQLLNDLLELSRIGRLMNPAELVPFEEIVREALDRVGGRLEKINAKVAIQSGLPVVHVDRTRLIEVVQNLLDNAAKYTNPKNHARIEIGYSGVLENGFYVFHIRDNGIGIEPEYHERIFGLFNKLDPISEGTGIGLSLVKRIIEVHNGKVWVESEPGNGASFYFSLPVPNSKE